jgi:hypothetical protein
MSLLPSSPGYSCLRYCLMVLAIITGSYVAYGQSTYGIVTSNNKPLSAAIVSNLASGKFVTSKMDGSFVLTVKKDDTLLTSYPGLKTDTLIFNNQSPLFITLKPLLHTLKDVVIKDTRNTPLENLKKNQSDYKQIYRIGDDKGWLMLGFGFAINVDKLYSLLSKQGKNARRLQKTIVRDYYDDIIDTHFTKSLVTKYTGYEGQQLDNFMIDNRPTYDFIKHASNYDVIEYILKAKKKYN